MVGGPDAVFCALGGNRRRSGALLTGNIHTVERILWTIRPPLPPVRGITLGIHEYRLA